MDLGIFVAGWVHAGGLAIRRVGLRSGADRAEAGFTAAAGRCGALPVGAAGRGHRGPEVSGG